MIYTSITNNKDNPREDILNIKYDKFKDPVLNAKAPKILSHLFIDNPYSIWVDGNLFLKQNAKVFIDLLGDSDIAVFENPYRSSIYEEAEACIKQELDNPQVINRQIERYKGFTSDKIGACFLIIRKHTERIKRLNEKWWAEICVGSKRDQISFPYVFDGVVKYLPKQHPFNNKYFKRIGHLK